MKRRGWIALALLVVLAPTAGCGQKGAAGAATPSGGTPPAAEGTPTGADVPANLFKNGSFESGPDPWISLTTPGWGTPFRVSSERAHSGKQSAALELRATSADTGAKVFGVVQELNPPEFPELLSGYYYVRDWVKTTPKQYLQFVVIAVGDTNLPGGFPNHQIRFPLAGIALPPFPISNAKFRFLNREEPATGRWVYFERPIRQDFQELWGAAPEGYQELRILFEVRYDDKAAGSEAKADVFYDDLYLGPAKGPNQP